MSADHAADVRTLTELRAEIESLKARLEEADEAIAAIRSGAVDAFVIDHDDRARVYTLEGADHPYRVLVEHMQQGALVFSSDGMVLFGNRRFAEFLGVPHERLGGSFVSEFVPVEAQAALAELICVGQRTPSRAELPLQRADGALVPADFTVSPLPLGATPLLCAIVTDLTEQKQHEELRNAQMALKDADRRKDEFIATLAHELRNPLAPVRNALEVLRLKTPHVAETRWAQDVIDRQLRQMTRLVDDLLDLSRITRSQVSLRLETTDLRAVIAAAVETTQPLIKECGHELTLSLPPEPIPLVADVTRLAQVFSNLLSNSAKFTERGGTIAVNAVIQDDGVVVTVSDNGDGISPELLPRIFDMFAQGDHQGQRSQSGLGIGLTLAKRLVEMHGGHITARSAGASKGSEFSVRLPRASIAGDMPSGGGDTASPSGEWRLLVVDDNRDSADSLAMVLRLLGNEVRVAYSGEHAMAVAAEFRPDALLLDLGMPGKSGYEVCAELRTQGVTRNAVIVALTGWGQNDDRRRTKDGGFDAHLVKPIEPDAVMRLLAGLLPSKRERNGMPASRPQARHDQASPEAPL